MISNHPMISDIQFNMSANILKEFDDWTLSIGNGELKEVHLTDEMVATIIAKNTKENPNSSLIYGKKVSG